MPSRMETCYDLILVCLGFGLCRRYRNGQEKHSGSDCPWNAYSAAVGSSIVMENVCLSQMMIVTWHACACRQTDSEKTSNADASEQASLDPERVSAGAQADSCSLVAKEIWISCAHQAGADAERQHGSKSENENGIGIVPSLSRASDLVIFVVGHRVEGGDGHRECKNRGHELRLGRRHGHRVG